MIQKLLLIAFFLVGPLTALAPRGLVSVLSGLGLIAAVDLLRSRAAMRLPRGPVVLCAALFIAYASSSPGRPLIWTDVPQEAALKVMQILALFASTICLVAVIRTLSDDQCDRLGNMFLAGLVIAVMFLLIEVFLDQPIYRLLNGLEASERISDNVLNRTAVILSLMIWPAALICWRKKLRAVAIFIPLAYLVMTTQMSSQSATLGVLLAIVVFVFALGSLRLVRWMIALVLVVGLAMGPYIATTMYDAGLSEASWLQRTARQRVEIWQYTAELIGQRPLLGVGFRAARAIDDRRAPEVLKSLNWPAMPLHPHDAFLQVLLELGAVGAAIVLAFEMSVLLAIRKLRPLSQHFALAEMAGAIGLLAVAYGVWQTWFMATLILAALSMMVADRAGKAD